MMRMLALACVLLACLSGCPEETPPTPTCTTGDEGCACFGNGTCNGTLVCENDVCAVPAGCTEGSAGCACYGNGTCDAGLECGSDNLCTSPTVTPGALGDPCDADRPCGTHTDGTALECTGGTCQLPTTCTPGTATCPCDNGTCTGNLVCTADVCVDPTCTAGTLDCPCDNGICGSGLTCNASNLCEALANPTQGISVGNGDVRSCTLVLDLADVTANFADTVRGKTKRKGSRLAVSFIAGSDAAIDGVAVGIVDGSGQAVDLSSVTPESVVCYDRKGSAVSAPAVTLQ